MSAVLHVFTKRTSFQPFPCFLSVPSRPNRSNDATTNLRILVIDAERSNTKTTGSDLSTRNSTKRSRLARNLGIVRETAAN